jgi:hypothetical protein
VIAGQNVIILVGTGNGSDRVPSAKNQKRHSATDHNLLSGSAARFAEKLRFSGTSH